MDLKTILSKIKRTPIDLRQLEALLPSRCGVLQYKEIPKNRTENYTYPIL